MSLTLLACIQQCMTVHHTLQTLERTTEIFVFPHFISYNEISFDKCYIFELAKNLFDGKVPNINRNCLDQS